jgi:hypothetical protein
VNRGDSLQRLPHTVPHLQNEEGTGTAGATMIAPFWGDLPTQPHSWTFSLRCICSHPSDNIIIFGDSRIGRNPRTRARKTQECTQEGTQELGDKESPRAYISPQKLCEPFYTCPPAPFIGRQREIFILILPLDLKNIPNGTCI